MFCLIDDAKVQRLLPDSKNLGEIFPELLRHALILATKPTHAINLCRKNTTFLTPCALRVTFSDGIVIEDKKAKITFTKTIQKIGLMRVRNLGIAFCGVPIVSNTLDKKYGKAQVPVEGGLYVMTHSSTHDKKKQLDKISRELDLGLKVEEI